MLERIYNLVEEKPIDLSSYKLCGFRSDGFCVSVTGYLDNRVEAEQLFNSFLNYHCHCANERICKWHEGRFNIH